MGRQDLASDTNHLTFLPVAFLHATQEQIYGLQKK